MTRSCAYLSDQSKMKKTKTIKMTKMQNLSLWGIQIRCHQQQSSSFQQVCTVPDRVICLHHHRIVQKPQAVGSGMQATCLCCLVRWIQINGLTSEQRLQVSLHPGRPGHTVFFAVFRNFTLGISHVSNFIEVAMKDVSLLGVPFMHVPFFSPLRISSLDRLG